MFIIARHTYREEEDNDKNTMENYFRLKKSEKYKNNKLFFKKTQR